MWHIFHDLQETKIWYRLLKNWFEIPSCISQLVIVVLNMREVIVNKQIFIKTHVFDFSNSPPAPRDLSLKLMTQTLNFKFLEKDTLNILSILPIYDTYVKNEGVFLILSYDEKKISQFCKIHSQLVETTFWIWQLKQSFENQKISL